MKKIVCILILIYNLSTLLAGNYYVDSFSGSDKNDGKSTETAWKSLDKVNTHLFQSGDSLLFHSGGIWSGYLKPKGSGSKTDPITISSYGEGARPLIAGNGIDKSSTVTLYNQSHWRICNLEITNNAQEYGDRRGVELRAVNFGVMEDIQLLNLKIHHVKGSPGDDMSHKRTAGIFVVASDDSKDYTRFDNVIIDNCVIHDVVNQGIVLYHEQFSNYPGEGTWNDRKFTNVIIKNNIVHHIAKNAMIIRMTEGGLVEHNICYETATQITGNTIFSRNVKGTVFSNNEGFLNKTHAYDGHMYDPDIYSPETIWEKSYSHHNGHGLGGYCNNQGNPKDKNIIFRDNISKNDWGHLMFFNYSFDNTDVYRNIFYTDELKSAYLIRENWDYSHLSITFRDNVIYSKSPNFAFEYGAISGEKNNRNFYNNIYLRSKPSYNPDRSDIGETIDLSGIQNLRKFHRGFIYQDEIDSLTNHNIDLFVPATNLEDKIIATVDNIPVYKFEFEREMRNQRSELLSLNIQVDESILLDKTMVAITLKKVQQKYMFAKNMVDASIMNDIDALCRKENIYRKSNINNEEIIITGPESFLEDDFFDYFFANAVELLKERMRTDELSFTEEELEEFFKTGDKDRINPQWKETNYKYYKQAAVRMLIDKKYNEFFEQETAKASVVTYLDEYTPFKIELDLPESASYTPGSRIIFPIKYGCGCFDKEIKIKSVAIYRSRNGEAPVLCLERSLSETLNQELITLEDIPTNEGIFDYSIFLLDSNNRRYELTHTAYVQSTKMIFDPNKNEGVHSKNSNLNLRLLMNTSGIGLNNLIIRRFYDGVYSNIVDVNLNGASSDEYNFSYNLREEQGKDLAFLFSVTTANNKKYDLSYKVSLSDSISVTDDTYIFANGQTSSSSINGSRDYLYTYYGGSMIWRYDTYLKFNLSESNLSPDKIESVKLRLFGNDSDPEITTHDLVVFSLGENDWSENNLNYDNVKTKVGNTSEIASLVTDIAPESKWYEWDITGLVVNKLKENEKIIGLKVSDRYAVRTSTSINDVLTFHSKENSTRKVPHIQITEKSFYIPHEDNPNSVDNESSSPGINVFYNNSSKLLSIENVTIGCRLFVSDLVGRIIINRKLNSSNSQIQFDRKGIFIVKIESDNSKSYSTIISNP